jgi:hypothetical protein
MSTARSERRAKEVGIRKVSGAMQNSLIIQFIAESIFIAGIAGVIALLLVQLSLPSFNTLKEAIVCGLWQSLFLALLWHLYYLPDWYPEVIRHFSSLLSKPVAVLKGSFKKAEALVTPRKVLVVAHSVLRSSSS